MVVAILGRGDLVGQGQTLHHDFTTTTSTIATTTTSSTTKLRQKVHNLGNQESKIKLIWFLAYFGYYFGLFWLDNLVSVTDTLFPSKM